MSARRKSLAGFVRVIGGDLTRMRRAVAQAASGRVAGPGQLTDNSGRLVPNLGDVQYVDRDGKQQIRVDNVTLRIVAHSPKALAAVVGPQEIAVVQEGVTENAEDIAEVDTRTAAFLLDHEDRIQDLEADVAADGVLISGLRNDLNDEIAARASGDNALIDRFTFYPVTITNDGPISVSDHINVFVKLDNTGGDVTAEFPVASDMTGGTWRVYVKAYDPGKVCAILVDGVTTPFFAVGEGGEYTSDGTDWYESP